MLINYNILNVFSDIDVCTCPMCMQPVSEEYKKDLVQSIQKVLSKVVQSVSDINFLNFIYLPPMSNSLFNDFYIKLFRLLS